MKTDPGNWTFSEFKSITSLQTETTFAYWLCAVDSDAIMPPIEALALAMVVHCDIEEQTDNSSEFNGIQDFTPSLLIPIAPVSFTDRWSPFPSAAEIMGEPMQIASHVGESRVLAYAIWKPKWLGDVITTGENDDENHFRYLLRLATTKSDKLNRDLFLMGQVGWSYDLAKSEAMNPEVAIAMLDYGYIFADRVSR